MKNIYILFTIMIFSSCDIQKLQKVTDDSVEFLEKRCECEKISGMTTSTNGDALMEIELVGCVFDEDPIQFSKSIHTIIVENIDDICIINNVSYLIINKGKLNSFTYPIFCN